MQNRDNSDTLPFWLDHESDDGWFSEGSRSSDQSIHRFTASQSRSTSGSRSYSLQTYRHSTPHSHLSSTSSASSSAQRFSRMFSQPVAVNCELENTFADLSKFVEEILYQIGSTCPPNSPMKLSASSLKRSPSRENMQLLSTSLSGLDLFNEKQNKIVKQIEISSSRNYGFLMDAARRLKRQVDYNPCVLNNILERKNIFLPETELNEIKDRLHFIQFIMFLYLSDKYPLHAKHDIFNYLLITTNVDGVNIYSVFREMDDQLYKSTLTKDAVEPYFDLNEINTLSAMGSSRR